MPIHPDQAASGVRALSSALSQMRRDNLATETALNVLIAQGVFDPADPYTVPEGVQIDPATACVQGTLYTWEEFADACVALVGAATFVNTQAVPGKAVPLATAMNRLVGL